MRNFHNREASAPLALRNVPIESLEWRHITIKSRRRQKRRSLFKALCFFIKYREGVKMRRMAKIIKISLFLFTATFATATIADAEEGAKLVFENFFKSFTTANPELMVSLFAEDALFWGTGSKSLVKSIDGIETYFSGLSSRTPRPGTIPSDLTIIELGEDHAMVSGTWAGEPLLRLSALVEKRNGEWKIIQFHNSSMPE